MSRAKRSVPADPIESIPQILFWTWTSVLMALTLVAGFVTWSARSIETGSDQHVITQPDCIVQSPARGRSRKKCTDTLSKRGRAILRGAPH